MPVRALAILALTAAALAVVAGAAPAAGARVPRAFFGVYFNAPVFPGVSLRAEARRVAATGAGSLVAAFEWVHAQPSPDGPVDFTRTDRVVEAAARARLRVLPVVVTSPEWARSAPLQAFAPPSDPARYGAYLTALVGRYGPKGSFWAEHRSLPRLAIRAWQVWNEPVGGVRADGPSIFWADSRPFQVGYVPLLRAARAAIKAADPAAQVVLAGLVGRSWGTLEILYRAGARGLFDAVSLHPYTGKPANVIRAVRLVRSVMRRAGDGRVPLLLTEVGWPSFDGDLRRGRAKLEAMQPRWLRRTLPPLIRARGRLGIEGLYWYPWMGFDRSRDHAFDHAGLVRLGSGGRVTAKPALRAFREVVRGARRR
jgi:hypothetical protein